MGFGQAKCSAIPQWRRPDHVGGDESSERSEPESNDQQALEAFEGQCQLDRQASDRNAAKNGNRRKAVRLALPEAKEVEAWGHPTFRAGKKMFAACGGEGGSWHLGMKMSFERQSQLVEDDRFFPTPYSAHPGWVSLHLDARTDWVEVEALIEEAYRQVAIRRMLKVLDADSKRI